VNIQPVCYNARMNDYERYSNVYVAVENDIGTTLVVRTQQDESPEDLHYEVLIHEDSTFYFNTGEDFYNWLDSLNKAFPRPK